MLLAIPRSTWFGGAVWLIAVLLSVIGILPLTFIELLLLSAPLLWTPLALQLLWLPGRWGGLLLRFAFWAQPIGAVGATLSLAFPGRASGALAAIWLVVAFLTLAATVIATFESPTLTLPAIMQVGAGIYLVLGANVLRESALGQGSRAMAPGNIDLLATHYHFAGFLLLALGSATVRRIQSRTVIRILLLPTVVLLMTIPVVIGTGDTTVVEYTGAILLIAAVVSFACITLFNVTPTLESTAARWLVRISCYTVFISMALGLIRSLGRAFGTPAPNFDEMLVTHGTLNAIGFIGAGLLGWVLISNKAHN
jgi:hypothetical protein